MIDIRDWDVHPIKSRLAMLIVIISVVAGSVNAQAIPRNATATFGGGWTCNLGFYRAGDQCTKTEVPANATATFGGGWTCNLGFKKEGERCVEMSQNEAQQQLLNLRTMRQQSKSEVHHLDGYEFTLLDIEKRCEAYVWDREYGELECNSSLRPVERNCEVYIYDWPNGEIGCRGSDLRFVERACSVEMYSDEYGSVSC